MKVIFKSFLLALTLLAAYSAVLFLTAQSAHAGSLADPAYRGPYKVAGVRSAVYPSQQGKVVNVIVEKVTTKVVSVHVIDEDNNVLAVQTVKQEPGAYHLTFNVNALPVGNYRIVVLGDKTQNRYPFSISKQKAVEAKRQISLL
jgi:hypothetical protein